MEPIVRPGSTQMCLACGSRPAALGVQLHTAAREAAQGQHGEKEKAAQDALLRCCAAALLRCCAGVLACWRTSVLVSCSA
jgi:hypothetical protein